MFGRREYLRNDSKATQEEKEQPRVLSKPMQKDHEDGEKADDKDDDGVGDFCQLVFFPLFRYG